MLTQSTHELSEQDKAKLENLRAMIAEALADGTYASDEEMTVEATCARGRERLRQRMRDAQHA